MSALPQTMQFELVSPERKLVSEPVRMAVIPGEEGELGVGPGHSSLVVALKPGVVKVYKNEQDENPRRIFIAGGFADVTNESCTVLAEEAVNVEDIDVAKIEQQIRNFTEDYNMATEASDKARFLARIRLAKDKLSAATGHLVA